MNFMFTTAKERLQRDHWEQQQSINAEAEESETEEENPTS
ncbi:small protein SR7P [Bacillus velezensis]